MQERRYRPGDVLDDYCPRERRVTDHAIVAMIDDQIQRTRCGICDAEHEYKEAKVPAPRRKTQPPALFTQVLDGLQGPTARLHSAPAPPSSETPDTPAIVAASPDSDASSIAEPLVRTQEREPAPPITESPIAEDREDGPVRRPLIRATFPKLEGAVPTPRALPEFTIQSLNNRNRPGGSRPGGHGKGRGRRRPGGGPDNHVGPMRFGRDNGQGGHGDGRPGGAGQGQGQGGGRRRRGGKKNH
jgi:hypothetical protein